MITLPPSGPNYIVSLSPSSKLVALAMAPATIEDFLLGGSWRILCVAVWSGPDIASARQLEDAVKGLELSVRVGIRPFERHSEFGAWMPELALTNGSPIWVSLELGKLRDVQIGTFSDSQVRDWVWGDSW